MAKYRKKPVVIEAVQWTGQNVSDICKFTERDVNHLIAGGQLYIATLEGVHRASVGDFIIKGVKGEFYPCKPDIFAQTYEPVNGVTFAKDTDVPSKIETNIFDIEEVHHNCTVQIQRNSVTGEQSIGWWPEEQPPKEV